MRIVCHYPTQAYDTHATFLRAQPLFHSKGLALETVSRCNSREALQRER